MTKIQSFFHDGPADYPVLDWSAYHVRAVTHDARQFPPPPADIISILVIKLDAYGDYILHTPFYAHLRKFYPHAKITLLCNTPVRELAMHNPAFDHVIGIPYAPGQNQGQAFLFAMELQTHAAAPFDLVIVPRWHEDWHHAGVIAQTLDAPYRLSYAANVVPYKAENFPQHDDYFTHVIEDTRSTHEVWRGMQLLHALGMPMPPVADIKQEIHATDEDTEKVAALLADKNYPRGLARPWIAFGISAWANFKCWPAAHFGELAQHILKSSGGTIFLFGHGTKDEAAAAIIQSHNATGVINMVSKLALRESTTLIGKCNAMVCNDSFTLHAAATHGVPIVEIVGQPADGRADSEYLPWCFGPWGAPFAWLQPLTCAGSQNLSEDFRREPKCIADVPPNHVFMALNEVMRRWPK
jgi:ADP-heptose:LPS heptosyltransferase